LDPAKTSCKIRGFTPKKNPFEGLKITRQGGDRPGRRDPGVKSLNRGLGKGQTEVVKKSKLGLGQKSLQCLESNIRKGNNFGGRGKIYKSTKNPEPRSRKSDCKKIGSGRKSGPPKERKGQKNAKKKARPRT